jgi:hypothetical protein
MNILMNKEFVEKKKKNYFITNSGKIEYFNILKLYSLDRQSLLDEESKRLKDLTKRMDDFFDENEIVDDQVKFRFLNLLLELDYSKIQILLNDPNDFDKILLYLAMNHPDTYPEFTSLEVFSSNYSIKKVTLDFFVEKIVEENFYALKFFKMKLNENQIYFFHADEKIEKILRAITVEKIRNLKLLKQLHKISEGGNPSLNSKLITTHILKDSLFRALFHQDLRSHLRKFIENTYLEYLTYQVEKKERSIKQQSRLHGIY